MEFCQECPISPVCNVYGKIGHAVQETDTALQAGGKLTTEVWEVINKYCHYKENIKGEKE